MRRSATLLAALALAGCAAVPPGTPQPDAVSGRLALQVDAHQDRPAQSLTATFDLRGNSERGELRLSTALGTTLAAAFWGPTEVRLVTPQGERLFEDLDTLSRDAFGETLPLRALPDWLRGRPWAGSAEPARPLQPGPGFVQLGWTIDLVRFDAGQLQAGRAGPPGVRLRAQMDPRRERARLLRSNHPVRCAEAGAVSLRALFDVPAPAKLNLFLHVLGRRADGYHLLQSVFVLIDWCDRLHFEQRHDGVLARHDLGAALPAEDLCLRAARALRSQSGTTLGADISVDKQLPWGAGLGGGSSDAASTLLALNRLWTLGWPRERLRALGATLGADVPFFIGGHNAFVEGIGERLTPLALPAQCFIVAKPAVALATADIFASPALVRDTEPAILTGSFANAEQLARLCSGFGRNDLQPVAEARCPEVRAVADWLAGQFGNSRMTGSGSAVFARVGIEDQSLAAGPAQPQPGSWIVRTCRSLDHHPLLGWAD